MKFNTRLGVTEYGATVRFNPTMFKMLEKLQVFYGNSTKTTVLRIALARLYEEVYQKEGKD